MAETRDRRQIIAVVIAVLLPLLAGLCYYEFPRYRNGSDAMEPTFHTGDLVYVRRGKAVSRGDLVAFHAPHEPKTILMKRVIAVGGDVIAIKEGRVVLNGHAIEEPYRSNSSGDNFEARLVPPNAYFVLGDNREKSNDSRFFGSVPRASLIGKPFVVVSPTGGIFFP
jgi:signal peptidase I